MYPVKHDAGDGIGWRAGDDAWRSWPDGMRPAARASREKGALASMYSDLNVDRGSRGWPNAALFFLSPSSIPDDARNAVKTGDSRAAVTDEVARHARSKSEWRRVK